MGRNRDGVSGKKASGAARWSPGRPTLCPGVWGVNLRASSALLVSEISARGGGAAQADVVATDLDFHDDRDADDTVAVVGVLAHVPAKGVGLNGFGDGVFAAEGAEIGRASCRESGE